MSCIWIDVQSLLTDQKERDLLDKTEATGQFQRISGSISSLGNIFKKSD